MKLKYSVSIDVDVDDVGRLYDAARHHMVHVDRVDEGDVEEFIGTRSDPDVAQCLVALFDPGQSPDGTSIVQSAAHQY